MTEYTYVQRPNYVLYGPNGELEELFCKVCGTAIGGMTEQVKGRRFEHGQWIEERILRFRRFHNYVELKMDFQDGSAHVTNGCRNCLHEGLTSDQMYELHLADMELDGAPYTIKSKARVPKGVVAIRSDGGGLV
jgi:hypothetical protein